MKSLNLSFGMKWLCSVIAGTAVAYLWTIIVLFFCEHQNSFDLLLPGLTNTTITITRLIIVFHASLKLVPVIGVQVLRKIMIRTELLYILVFYWIWCYFINHMWPGMNIVYDHWQMQDMSISRLYDHISQHPYSFSWFIATRLIIPIVLATVYARFLKLRNIITDKGWWRSLFVEGRGSGGKWAGLLTINKLKTKIGWRLNSQHVILGRAVFGDHPMSPVIRAPKDSHTITSALTGSGKETTSQLPQLAVFKGGMVVVDVKGSLAQETFKYRSSKPWLETLNMNGGGRHLHKNARAYVFDPRGITDHLPRFKYNFLSEIDLFDSNAVELLDVIAEACIEADPKHPHFSDMAKSLLIGLCIYVLSTQPEENQNMPYVYDLLSGVLDPDMPYADPTKFDKELLPLMMKCDAMGGLASGIASKLSQMGAEERGGCLSTLYRGIKFCAYPEMRWQLSHSDFKFSEFYDNTSTLYFVLDIIKSPSFTRWLRVMIGLSFILLRKKKPRKGIPTLYMLDEMGSYIDMPVLNKAFEIVRNFGQRIHGYVQSFNQIEKGAPKRYQTILANTNLHIYGLKDLQDAKMVSQILGHHIIKIKKGRGRYSNTVEQIKPLLTPTELMLKLGRDANRSIFIPIDGFPTRLERCTFKPLKIEGKRFYEYSPFIFKGCFNRW